MTNTTNQVSLIPRSRKGEPTWELVDQFPTQGHFPIQGHWTEEAYLAINSSRLIELVAGVLEFPPMPTWSHQLIVEFLHRHLKSFVQERNLGLVAFAPLRVRVGVERYREPDVIFCSTTRIKDFTSPAEGADLVMEVVSGSPADRDRDYIEKRKDYAAAGIPEYWIVDPDESRITVLTLYHLSTEYKVEGEFHLGCIATSRLLPGFQIDTTACFAAGQLTTNADDSRE